MIKRVVVVSHPARLSYRHRQLVVDRANEDSVTVPVEDLGVLILDHPQVTQTHGLLSACAAENVAVIFSDVHHLPVAILMPLVGHTLHSRTLAMQVTVSGPHRKRMWRDIVRAKVGEQAKVLERITGSDHGLGTYVKRVRSGDPDNIEAQVARLYWIILFGNDFRRQSGPAGINGALNFGYAILRAAVARAVVGAGLHPALGLHHHNQYDALCLADDLMEPLRPLIDRQVAGIPGADLRTGRPLEPRDKQWLLETLSESCQYNGRQYPVLVALHEYAANVRQVMAGEVSRLHIPVL